MGDETRRMAEQAVRDRETAEAIFAQRRYHEAGNRLDGTFANLRKWERIGFWYFLFSLFVGMPLCVAVMVDMFLRFGPREPLPWYYILFFPVCCVFVCPAIGYLGVWMTRAGEQRGRWVIAWNGVFYRYGKESHRFVSFSAVRGVRVEKPKSVFPCVVFQTEGEPLRIGERVDGGHSTDFLPFLNELVDRLQNADPAMPGLDTLVLLRNHRRMQLLERLRLPYFALLQMGVYVFPLLPAAIAMAQLKNPALGYLLTASGFLIFGTVAVGHFLWRLTEHWKVRRLDELYSELLRREKEIRTENLSEDRHRSHHGYPPPRLEPGNFGPVPRRVTVAARRRLRFTWASLMGWAALLLAGFLLVGVATEGKVVAVLGMAVLLAVFPGGLGTYCVIYERYFGKKVIALFADGIPVRGRVRHVGAFRLTVELPPEYGGTVKLMREDHQRKLHAGERVTVFIERLENMEEPRFPDESASRENAQRKIRRAVYEQTALAVHYDRNANSFDTESRLPWAEPFCVLLFLGSLMAVVRLLLPF